MKIVVGLSGGVDSSVVACMLKRQGHEVVGVTMKLWSGKYKGGSKDACFSPDEDKDIASAKALCDRLGIEHHVIDCSKEYDDTIIKYFKDSYASGKTPNPCVRCNAEFKFGMLPMMAKKKLGDFDKFATGHYASIELHNGKFYLKKARCNEKDQSYFLSRLSQEQLSMALFPLGRVKSKNTTRRLAKMYGLDVADKPDSMDFYSGDVNELIGKPDQIGNILDQNMNVIGKHNGYWHYTIGQRKGLNVSSLVPLYVTDIKACHNAIVVGPIETAMKDHFKIENINWFVDYSNEANTNKCNIKIRSNGKTHRGYVVKYSIDTTLDDNIIMDEPMFGVTPGQLAVAYDDNGYVVCSGYII